MKLVHLSLRKRLASLHYSSKQLLSFGKGITRGNEFEKSHYIEKITRRRQKENCKTIAESLTVQRSKILNTFASDYLESLIKITSLERAAVLTKEVHWQHHLSRQEMELRGLAVFDLRLDSNYFRSINTGEVELRLFRSNLSKDSIGVEKSFRRGKLVDITQGKYKAYRSDANSWRKVPGIISSVSENEICVRVQSIANFLSELLSESQQTEVSCPNQVCLLKRSEGTIYDRNIHALKRSLNDDGLESSPDVSNQSFPNYIEFLSTAQLNSSQLQAVEQCSNSKEPVTIIHGPPGTGKTRALAACAISAVSSGQKVLVVAPSHAACDAVMLAVLKLWQNYYSKLGSADSGILLRIGKESRLTIQGLKRYLPLHQTSDDDKIKFRSILFDLQIARQELINKSCGTSDRGELLRLETTLVEKLQLEQEAIEKLAMDKAKLIVMTNMSSLSREVMTRLSRNVTYD